MTHDKSKDRKVALTSKEAVEIARSIQKNLDAHKQRRHAIVQAAIRKIEALDIQASETHKDLFRDLARLAFQDPEAFAKDDDWALDVTKLPIGEVALVYAPDNCNCAVCIARRASAKSADDALDEAFGAEEPAQAQVH